MSPPNRSRHTHTLALHESSCFGTNRSSATPSGGWLSHPFPDHIIEYSAFTAIYRRLQLKISPPSPTANYERGAAPGPPTGLTASRSQRRIDESGRTGKRQGRKCPLEGAMSSLVVMPREPFGNFNNENNEARSREVPRCEITYCQKYPGPRLQFKPAIRQRVGTVVSQIRN